MKYYKAFNEDMTCKEFQYKVGGIYKLPKNEKLELYCNGFHFCDMLNYCFKFYDEDICVICEVEPLGNIVRNGYSNILATDKIRIVRKLSKEEIEKERYIIQDSVRVIGECVFDNCTSLTDITIPDSVTTIGEYAFAGCTLLKSITIPNSVTVIRNKAFRCCASLTNIIIPSSVVTIGRYAFYNCASLKNVTIPNSVTSIGENAFCGCKSLTNITISNSITCLSKKQ